jgi:hypothetical protein
VYGQQGAHYPVMAVVGSFPPVRSLVSRRGRRVLNGVAIHRTSLPPFIRARGESARTARGAGSAPGPDQDNQKRGGPVHGEARQQDRLVEQFRRSFQRIVSLGMIYSVDDLFLQMEASDTGTPPGRPLSDRWATMGSAATKFAFNECAEPRPSAELEDRATLKSLAL